MKAYRVTGERTGRGGDLTITDTEPILVKVRNPMLHLKPKKKKRKR